MEYIMQMLLQMLGVREYLTEDVEFLPADNSGIQISITGDTFMNKVINSLRNSGYFISRTSYFGQDKIKVKLEDLLLGEDRVTFFFIASFINEPEKETRTYLELIPVAIQQKNSNINLGALYVPYNDK